jgi:predicted SAM-dependent methyltransferase
MSRKLHIGGIQKYPGWEVLNIMPGSHVDHLCDARDLSQFPDNSFIYLYASHVLEHFDYSGELSLVLKEWCRVLKPGGRIYISVPDLDTLSNLYLQKEHLTLEERFFLMRMMFGGHCNQFDYHLVGLNLDFLTIFLQQAGFIAIQRVDNLGFFEDASCILFKGTPISLNMIAEKPTHKA